MFYRCICVNSLHKWAVPVTFYFVVSLFWWWVNVSHQTSLPMLQNTELPNAGFPNTDSPVVTPALLPPPPPSSQILYEYTNVGNTVHVHWGVGEVGTCIGFIHTIFDIETHGTMLFISKDDEVAIHSTIRWAFKRFLPCSDEECVHTHLRLYAPLPLWGIIGALLPRTRIGRWGVNLFAKCYQDTTLKMREK